MLLRHRNKRVRTKSRRNPPKGAGREERLHRQAEDRASPWQRGLQRHPGAFEAISSGIASRPYGTVVMCGVKELERQVRHPVGTGKLELGAEEAAVQRIDAARVCLRALGLGQKRHAALSTGSDSGRQSTLTAIHRRTVKFDSEPGFLQLDRQDMSNPVVDCRVGHDSCLLRPICQQIGHSKPLGTDVRGECLCTSDVGPREKVASGTF